MGSPYEVEDLDLPQRRALVRPFVGDWYTQPKRESETWIEQVREQRECCGVVLSFGIVSVTEQVVAYQKKRVSDHSVVDLLALDMPEQEFVTQALWYELPDELLREEFPLDVLQGSLHAAEHGQIAVLPLIAMCDRWDIGGLSTAFHRQTGRATIFIYDGHPGGVGITRVGYERFETLVDDALRLISRVPLPRRLPVVRAVAQVRQPQRAAQQARRRRAAEPHGLALTTAKFGCSRNDSRRPPKRSRRCDFAGSFPPSSWRSQRQQHWGRLSQRRPAGAGELSPRRPLRGGQRRGRPARRAPKRKRRVKAPAGLGEGRPPRFPLAGAFSWGGPARASALAAGPPPPGPGSGRRPRHARGGSLRGTVEVGAYQARGAGHYVVLDGDREDYDYVFMHLRTGSTTVRPGEHVRAGQALGEVGSTGASSGPHLHFEVWVGGWFTGGRPIDPLALLTTWSGLSPASG